MKYRNYAKILLEETEKTAQAQAPEGSELGLYAFAPERRSNSELEIPWEPNTQIEKQLLSAIIDHVHANFWLPPKHTALVKKFIENGWYSKIIKPPPSGTMIHRGQAISIKRLRRILGLKSGEKIPGYEGESSVNFTWTNPVGKVEDSYDEERPAGPDFGSSWSKVFDSAYSYSGRQVGIKRQAGVVFTAASGQEKNFLDLTPTENHSNLYKFIISAYHNENECIALGPVKVSKILWQIPSYFKQDPIVSKEIDG